MHCHHVSSASEQTLNSRGDVVPCSNCRFSMMNDAIQKNKGQQLAAAPGWITWLNGGPLSISWTELRGRIALRILVCQSSIEIWCFSTFANNKSTIIRCFNLSSLERDVLYLHTWSMSRWMPYCYNSADIQSNSILAGSRAYGWEKNVRVKRPRLCTPLQQCQVHDKL